MVGVFPTVEWIVPRILARAFVADCRQFRLHISRRLIPRTQRRMNTNITYILCAMRTRRIDRRARARSLTSQSDYERARASHVDVTTTSTMHKIHSIRIHARQTPHNTTTTTTQFLGALPCRGIVVAIIASHPHDVARRALSSSLLPPRRRVSPNFSGPIFLPARQNERGRGIAAQSKLLRARAKRFMPRIFRGRTMRSGPVSVCIQRLAHAIVSSSS